VHVLARKSGRNETFVNQALHLVLRLALRTLYPSESAIMRMAYWSCHGLSGYDATFVALAEDLDGRWLTADERAVKIAGPKNCQALRAWGA